MAVTKTDQFHVWPYPGQLDDWLADGQGVHTVFARDLPGALNNIGSYCNPWAQYMQGCVKDVGTGSDGTVTVTTSAAGEYLIFQCPIVVPPGARRLFWTAGVISLAGTGTIETAAVYLSTSEYTKTLQTAAFDTSGVYPQRRLLGGLGPPRGSGYKTVGALTNSYRLVTDTEIDIHGKGGIMDLDASCTTVSSGTGQTRLSNLIFTLTCSGPSALVMGVADFTCWFLYD